jgi:hypothetical protein
MTPGIYENLSNEEYHSAPGLSNSALKTFLVSPLHYWHEKRNPAMECAICQAPRSAHPTVTCRYFAGQAETPALRLGSALHVAVLEPDKFLDRYAPRPSAADWPDALTTVDEMKKWMDAKAVPYKKSALKPELEAAAAEAGAPILSRLMSDHAKSNAGKKYLDKAEWAQVRGMAKALRREAELKTYLAEGVGEVSILAVDPDTGVLLKCRLDWMAASRTIVDLKSFSARGESIDATVSKAIAYQGYYRQAWFYMHVMKLAGITDFGWLYAFVESDAPYEVRLRSMGISGDRGINKYWDATGAEIRGALKKFAEYEADFGPGEPWAYHQAIEPVRDSELSRVVWTGRDEE